MDKIETISKIITSFTGPTSPKVYYITKNLGITENAKQSKTEIFIDCLANSSVNSEIKKAYEKKKKVVLTGPYASVALVKYIKFLKLKEDPENIIYFICSLYPGFFLSEKEIKDYLN